MKDTPSRVTKVVADHDDLLKVSSFRKNISVFSFLPKNEQKISDPIG